MLGDQMLKNLRDDIPVVEIDANVNDEAFSRQCAATLLENMTAG